MPNINLIRALTIAANGLRYNPELDPNDAYMYEQLVIACRDSMGAIRREQDNG